MAIAALEDLKRVYHRAWWALMLRGLFGVTVGLFVIGRPLESVATFALLIAFWALFSGIVDIVTAFEVKPAMNHWWVTVLAGLVSAGFGIAALMYYPALSLTFAVIWVSWWLMASGVLAFYGAFMLRRLGLHWGMPALFGVLGIVAGAYAIMAPPVTLAAIMGLIGGFALASGIVLVAAALKLRSLIHA